MPPVTSPLNYANAAASSIPSLKIYNDAKSVNINKVHSMLADTYWGHRRDKDTLKVAVEHSICYSAYRGDVQVGFGRIMTDYATAAYLTDVIVEPDERGKGIGKLIVEAMMSDPRIQNCYVMLSTSDAGGFYAPFGFKKDETFYSNTDKIKPSHGSSGIHLAHSNVKANSCTSSAQN